jgi:acid phosphatase type 7
MSILLASMPLVLAAGPSDTGSTTEGVEVAVLSDLNSAYGSKAYGEAVHAAVTHLISAPPDLVLITGDMVAGQRPGLDYEGMWKAFYKDVLSPLQEAGIPVAATPGNHDASAYGPFREEREIYERLWKEWKPSLEYVDDAGYPLHYAFTLGGALFVSIDATQVGALPEGQMEWMEGLPWAENSVVFGHMPLYPFAQGREREYIGSGDLESLWREAGVDLYVSGHHHSYYPGERDGLGLVSTACLGSGPRRLIGSESDASKALLRFGLDSAGLTGLEAFIAPHFVETIERRTLPVSVGKGSRQIVRDDLQ